MNITKEQIKEWMDNSGIKFVNPYDLSEAIEQCFNDLSPKWVSVDEITPEDDNVFYWVRLENGYIELMRLNKYTAIGGRKDYWQDLSGNDFDMKGSHFIEVTLPK